MNLIKWDEMRTQIEASKDIDELTNLSDRLRAYQVLAEQSKQSSEVQSKIAIYKARADRKCGEWLRENIPKHNEKNGLQDVTRLKDIGVAKHESARLQKIAEIPDDKFEEILLDAEIETKKITNNMLVNIAKEAAKHEKKINTDNDSDIINDTRTKDELLESGIDAISNDMGKNFSELSRYKVKCPDCGGTFEIDICKLPA